MLTVLPEMHYSTSIMALRNLSLTFAEQLHYLDQDRLVAAVPILLRRCDRESGYCFRTPARFQAAAAQGGFGVETETCRQLLSLQDMSR